MPKDSKYHGTQHNDTEQNDTEHTYTEHNVITLSLMTLSRVTISVTMCYVLFYCLNTNNYSYLETSGGQSSNLI
jgi:hypothetical protein